MKILFISSQYYPTIGGIPFLSKNLIEFFVKKKNQVILITNSDNIKKKKLNFKIYSNINKKKINELHDWADIIFHNHISLRLSSLKFSHLKKTVVTTQYWLLDKLNFSSILLYFLKKLFLKLCAERIFISKSIKKHINLKGKIINNFYNDKIFKDKKNYLLRTKKIAFVGNLFSHKGLTTFLQAVQKLKSKLNHKDVTILGGGKNYIFYKKLVKDLNLEKYISFEGAKSNFIVSKILNNHKILVVPSYNEPFGIVALEGLASGCNTILSNNKGLSEFDKRFFYFFKNKDSNELSKKILKCLKLNKSKKNNKSVYLKKFTIENIGKQYLSIFHNLKKNV